ncbi:hypothetical protein GGTG_04701 [Gaeumannomyces tritici R3-111a-1]|uniref:Uncharacterized protein n=1 Tax=Gaeumannomyces tritici (strain R3-111a-1) TaxID=644352 RepID=J3NTV2_GAET3|nr:hypothetical protein GGTG_04701 [Gaeumannomyces tritici R3-111a-1]EJT79617.1 hypothetical protein GGTG_04701 [Gaeumannomyces tritici R3-111a-1]
MQLLRRIEAAEDVIKFPRETEAAEDVIKFPRETEAAEDMQQYAKPKTTASAAPGPGIPADESRREMTDKYRICVAGAWDTPADESRREIADKYRICVAGDDDWWLYGNSYYHIVCFNARGRRQMQLGFTASASPTTRPAFYGVDLPFTASTSPTTPGSVKARLPAVRAASHERRRGGTTTASVFAYAST